MSYILSIFKLPDLRKKLAFTLLIVFLYRLGTHIPISGIDLLSLEKLFSQGGVLGFFNLFSGGGLSRFSVFALGILPYINASIIIQLMTIILPQLKELSEEGEYGRKQISQYTRYLAMGIGIIQAFVMSIGFRQFLFPNVSFGFFLFYSVLSLIAGTALVMWFGELITEFGIGNGASVLIFVGIIAQMPGYIHNTYVLVQGGASILGVIALIFVFLFIIVAIVTVQEAQRKIPIHYAKRVVGNKMYTGKSTYIPLRLIQGGVMPIIFASAVLQFPLMISHYVDIDAVKTFFSVYYRYDGFVYNFIFCMLIFFFTYFYTAITFNPQELSDNIKKYGGFVAGVRTGKSTVEYLDSIISRLTLVGAVFLSFLALVPIVTANITKISTFMGLGGTALLIIVGVTLDLLRQVDSLLVSKRYEGFL